MPALTVNGGAGNDTLNVLAGGSDFGSDILNGVAQGSFSNATSFTFNGSTGADTFIIANPMSGLFAPSGGVTFNGGLQFGDALVELGGSALGDGYSPTSNTSGVLTYVTHDVQCVTVGGSSGTFKLTLNGQTTAPLPFNATALQVQAALNNLSGVLNAGGAVVDQAGNQYTIFFGDLQVVLDEAQMTAAASGGATASVVTLADGGVHRISFTGTVFLVDAVGPERPGAFSEFSIDGLSNATVTLTDGPAVNGEQASLISSNGVFAPIEIANKTSVFISTFGSSSSIILNNPHPEAGLSSLSLVTDTGSIAQMGAPDGLANAVAPSIVIQTRGGTVGSAGAPLEVDVSTGLNVSALLSDVSVTDTSGSFPISGVGTAGNVTLTSLGSGLTSLEPGDGLADVIGDVVTLRATGPSTGDAGQIGLRDPTTSLPQFFDIYASVLNASTNNSALFIDDVGPVNDGTFPTDPGSSVAIGSVNAGNNSANLRIDGGKMTSRTVDGVADITAQFVNLSTTSAGGSFGTSDGDPLEINATVFSAATTGPGSVYLKDTASDVSLSFASVTSGDLSVTVPGRLELKNSAQALGNVTFHIGGDFYFGAGDNGHFFAGGTITILADTDNNDPGVGANVTITNPFDAPSVSIAGNSDNDTLTLGPAVHANVTLLGNGGDDTLTGGRGNDILDGGAGDDTAVFSGNLASYALNDLGTKVTMSGPDGNDTLLSIEHLQFADGTINANDGSAIFDTIFYDRNNLDVFHAGLNALNHYNSTGWHEGRDPNAFFSTKGYLGANADVTAAGVNPLTHYDVSGWKEGRDPSASFDTTLYLLHNPDVKAAGIDPLAHFLSSGMAEGRAAYGAIGPSIVNGFDAEYYLLANPDVAAAGVDPLQHFMNAGWKEGRSPDAYFDAKGYLAAYPDVAAAGINPLTHYETSGWKEGRDPSGQFDTLHYLQAYSDVAAAHISPLDHFLVAGAYELRQTFADGLFH